MAIETPPSDPDHLRLVLLHGFTQTARSWDPIRAELVRSDVVRDRIDILTPDLPGHGSRSDMASDLPTAAVELADRIGNGHLVGYSMGGRLALHLAILRPEAVRSLVLISSTAGIDDADEREARRTADHRLAQRIEQIGVEHFIAEWLAQPLFGTLREASSAYRLENTSEGLAASLRLAGTGEHRPLWAEISRVETPTLVVTGAQDTKFTELGRRLVATMPNARRITVPDAGHAVHLEHPDTIAHIIVEWLTEIEPSGGDPQRSG
jgi:2-succinyl-6-hydroxy-2,4-cyclohexadiene-1-carboxylate synthase